MHSKKYAKLTYPVGLLSGPEANLLTINILKTGNHYWVISIGGQYGFSIYGLYINTSGCFMYEDQTDRVDTTLGVRPVVSLKPNITYSSGTGTVSDPYKISSIYKATFYYQSSSINGEQTIASKKVECEASGDTTFYATYSSAIQNYYYE